MCVPLISFSLSIPTQEFDLLLSSMIPLQLYKKTHRSQHLHWHTSDPTSRLQTCHKYYKNHCKSFHTNDRHQSTLTQAPQILSKTLTRALTKPASTTHPPWSLSIPSLSAALYWVHSQPQRRRVSRVPCSPTSLKEESRKDVKTLTARLTSATFLDISANSANFRAKMLSPRIWGTGVNPTAHIILMVLPRLDMMSIHGLSPNVLIRCRPPPWVSLPLFYLSLTIAFALVLYLYLSIIPLVHIPILTRVYPWHSLNKRLDRTRQYSYLKLGKRNENWDVSFFCMEKTRRMENGEWSTPVQPEASLTKLQDKSDLVGVSVYGHIIISASHSYWSSFSWRLAFYGFQLRINIQQQGSKK